MKSKGVSLILFVVVALVAGCSGFRVGQPDKTDTGSTSNPTPTPTPTPTPGGCGQPLQPPPAIRTISLGPADDYCAKINSARPGDKLEFAPGSYSEPCSINVAGTAQHPIYLKSQFADVNRRAKFDYPGSSANVWEIRGQHLIVSDFLFADTSDDAFVVRLWAVSDVTIENNHFVNTNQVIAANSGDTNNLIIRNNRMKGVRDTAVYLGCHNGSCRSTNFIFEGNFIDASHISTGGVGYGVEVKLNSYGILRDNSIFGAQGPGMMVYGSQNATAPPIVIEGNYIHGSRNDAALNVAGGPARVTNNVIINSGSEALYTQNYGGRGLLRNVHILNNTIIGLNATSANLSGLSAGNNIFAGNAITNPIVPANPNAAVIGNQICSGLDCFAAPYTSSPYDFTPKEAGPLLVSPSGYEPPPFDFFGQPRAPNQIGAIMLNSQSHGTLQYLYPRPSRQQYCF
jgi:hypothetical protein